VEQISKKDKTSLAIDRDKLAQVKEILGTRTLAETVDAAFDDVIKHEGYRRLIARIRNSKTGGIGPTPDELRRLREP
jgi:Arc/MetJ family transcription regulator